MAKNSKIEWTDHTFNPWWGCEKVSPGCAHCYAETFSRRVGYSDAPHDGEPGSQTGPKVRLWGPGSERRMFGDKHWSEPLAWDRAAAEAGTRARVFCASMADVFEDRPELAAPRATLFGLTIATPNLDWLLLTKRPENADRLWSTAHKHDYAEWSGWVAGDGDPGATWRPNVWLGTTVEDQQRADERIPHLLAVPAAVRFLSCEPLLGPVALNPTWLPAHTEPPIFSKRVARKREGWVGNGIDWVIAGGESGPGARPMHPKWARSLRDQCAAAGVPFLWKQWGEWAPDCLCGGEKPCRETPRPMPGPAGVMFRCGKSAAGRVLDGCTHDAFPEVSR